MNSIIFFYRVRMGIDVVVYSIGKNSDPSSFLRVLWDPQTPVCKTVCDAAAAIRDVQTRAKSVVIVQKGTPAETAMSFYSMISDYEYVGADQTTIKNMPGLTVAHGAEWLKYAATSDDNAAKKTFKEIPEVSKRVYAVQQAEDFGRTVLDFVDDPVIFGEVREALKRSTKIGLTPTIQD